MSLLDNLYVNLRVISKIPEGGRICTTGAGQVKIEDTKTLGGWLSTGRRRITGDSRDESVKTIMQIVNDVSELSDNIVDSLKTDNSTHSASMGILNENVKKCHNLQKLSVMLKNSKKGIVNLHATYQDDANITARIDEIMDKIDQQCETIAHVLEYMRQQKRFNIDDASPSRRSYADVVAARHPSSLTPTPRSEAVADYRPRHGPHAPHASPASIQYSSDDEDDVSLPDLNM